MASRRRRRARSAWTAVGAPNESTTTNASAGVAVGAQPGDGDDVAEPVDGAERAAVGAS